jgi:hypothetical protein
MPRDTVNENHEAQATWGSGRFSNRALLALHAEKTVGLLPDMTHESQIQKLVQVR